MSEEQNTQEPVKKEVTETQKPKEDINQGVSQADIDELNAEIEKLNKEIVSEDTAKLIAVEKEKAKKEAEKEFLVNQRIKEMEQEKEAMKKEREESERRSAEQLQALKTKIDSLSASRAVVKNDNPFAEPSNNPPSPSQTNLTDEQVSDIERASFELFMKEKSRNIY
jgi:uncharacterized protein (DUF3084 family)